MCLLRLPSSALNALLLISTLASSTMSTTVPTGNNSTVHTASDAPAVMDTEGDKVMNGAPAELGSIVELSGMTTKGELLHICTGVLVSHRWVLSAAHCQALLPANARLYSTIGRRDLGNWISGTQIPISQVVAHPGWRMGSNDIALYQLESTTFVNFPIERSYDPRSPQPGEKVQVYGYGLTYPNRRKLQTWWWPVPVEGGVTLRVGDLTVLDDAACNQQWKGLLDDGDFCVQPGPQTTCAGDSGGPVMKGNTLVGITSFGAGSKCSTQGPAVFTRVGKFSGWISSVVNDRRLNADNDTAADSSQSTQHQQQQQQHQQQHHLRGLRSA